MKEAASHGADLVLFPEVQLTEFFPQYPGQDVRKYQIPLDSDIIRRFCDTCRKNQIMAVPNIYLLENERPYDASILINKTVKFWEFRKWYTSLRLINFLNRTTILRLMTDSKFLKQNLEN